MNYSYSLQLLGCCFTGSLTTRYIPEAKGLKIVNASKTDSGIFTCRALQVGKEDGFVESVDITFKVQRKCDVPNVITPISSIILFTMVLIFYIRL